MLKASQVVPVVKNLPAYAGDPGLIPGSARSAGEGIGYPLQYSWASLLPRLVKNLPANVGDLGSTSRCSSLIHPREPGGFPHRTLDEEAGVCVLVSTLLPAPKGAWSRHLLPGPQVSPPMKQGDNKS